MAITRTIAGRRFSFGMDDVRHAIAGVDPEPLRQHFVVVDGRRFPPKQVLALVTGLDRADFTTHQARRILQRAGLSVGRAGEQPVTTRRRHDWPHGGREAELLRPYTGRWVAQRGLEVLFASDTPKEVVAWLNTHEQSDAAVFRVPRTEADVDTSTWGLNR